MMNEGQKDLFFIGSSLKDLRDLPKDVREIFGYGLHLAQMGGIHPDAKPLKGFGSAGVLELMENHDGETYRAVYTIRLPGCVYVLHAFHKKSKKGIATPQTDIDLIRARLRAAEDHYRQRKERTE